jgi:ASC-1-like (ASCH) protein
MPKNSESGPRSEKQYNHSLTIYEENLQLIKSGLKTLEVRLEDDKISKIKPGDIIKFMSSATEIRVRIKDVRRYQSLEELVANEDANKILPGRTVDQILSLPLAKIYTRSRQNKIVLEIEALP